MWEMMKLSKYYYYSLLVFVHVWWELMPITFGKDNVLLSITKILLIDSCSLLVRFVSDIFLTENSFKIKQVFFCCNRFLCFLVRQKFVKSQKSFSVKKLWRIRSKTKTSFLFFTFCGFSKEPSDQKLIRSKKSKKCEIVALELVFAKNEAFYVGIFYRGTQS